MICLCLTLQTLEDNTTLIKHNRAYIDMVELRVDMLDPRLQEWEHLVLWAKRGAEQMDLHLPIIFTIRLPQDGGNWKGSEEKRIQLLLQAVASPLFQYVDIEQNIASLSNDNPSIDDMLKHTHLDTKIILSEHHFGTQTLPKEKPEKKSEKKIIATSKAYPQCIIKSAVSCETSAAMCDFFEQSQILERTIPDKYIVVSMGSFGLLGRILRSITGSLLTYTSDASSHLHTQLGHIDPQTLEDTYQYRNITRSNTELYGVVGNPCLHSLSPLLHNNYFKEAESMQSLSTSSEPRKNKVYIHIPLDDITQLPRLAKCINLKGASITIPHKQSVIALLDEMEHIVEQCQSCNTVMINSQGKWKGYNTDIAGFLVPLESVMKGQDEQRNVCILGAGGVARGIAFALLQKGYNLLIVNRTLEKADALAQQMAQQMALELAEKMPKKMAQQIDFSKKISTAHINDYETIKKHAHIIVQTTSIGMDDPEATPLPAYQFTGTEIVYDVIYTPKITKLMQDAKDSGCAVISGEAMFYEQGYLQSQLFLGE